MDEVVGEYFKDPSRGLGACAQITTVSRFIPRHRDYADRRFASRRGKFSVTRKSLKSSGLGEIQLNFILAEFAATKSLLLGLQWILQIL
jgi:hypothetical protein